MQTPMLDTPQGSYPLRYSVEQIPENPDAQVAATIARMCQYVCEDSQAIPIIHDARRAVALDPNNPLAAIHSFVRSRMRFKRDEEITEPYGWMLPKSTQGKPDENYFVECLKRPVDVCFECNNTGDRVEGDCDDFSMYTAALLKALGIDCCFATVGASKQDPSVYSHVYVVAYWLGKRYPMDCSHGQQAGWEYAAPDSGLRYAEWPIYDRASLAPLGLAIVLGGWWAWMHRKEIRGLFA